MEIRLYRNRIMVWVGILLVTLSLAIGVTWGRYYESLESEITLEIAEANTYYLWEVESEETGEESAAEESQILQFGVSNGTSDTTYTSQDMSLTPVLYLSENIGNTEYITVSLTVTVEEITTTYVGQGTAIVEQTNLYYTFGPGWSYIFYDEDGAELQLELSGDTYTTIQGSVIVAETENDSEEEVEAYLMRLIMREN